MEHLIDNLIDLAFAEDLGEGDHTTLCSIPKSAIGQAKLIIKEAGILAGVEVGVRVFHKLDPQIKINVLIKDGSKVAPGDVVFTVEGKVQSILQAERTVLNIMQRMSGIATTTNKYV
ncbi:MAG: nicotinate-nucleotide diphosphorylase (carboxylating), partial [Bacteroidales bacterium]|nr:nicotinate-nucleotide diphosphorylase (carboxylating) [Bacteroidales bacterium]